MASIGLAVWMFVILLVTQLSAAHLSDVERSPKSTVANEELSKWSLSCSGRPTSKCLTETENDDLAKRLSCSFEVIDNTITSPARIHLPVCGPTEDSPNGPDVWKNIPWYPYQFRYAEEALTGNFAVKSNCTAITGVPSPGHIISPSAIATLRTSAYLDPYGECRGYEVSFWVRFSDQPVYTPDHGDPERFYLSVELYRSRNATIHTLPQSIIWGNKQADFSKFKPNTWTKIVAPFLEDSAFNLVFFAHHRNGCVEDSGVIYLDDVTTSAICDPDFDNRTTTLRTTTRRSTSLKTTSSRDPTRATVSRRPIDPNPPKTTHTTGTTRSAPTTTTTGATRTTKRFPFPQGTTQLITPAPPHCATVSTRCMSYAEQTLFKQKLSCSFENIDLSIQAADRYYLPVCGSTESSYETGAIDAWRTTSWYPYQFQFSSQNAVEGDFSVKSNCMRSRFPSYSITSFNATATLRSSQFNFHSECRRFYVSFWVWFSETPKYSADHSDRYRFFLTLSLYRPLGQVPDVVPASSQETLWGYSQSDFASLTGGRWYHVDVEFVGKDAFHLVFSAHHKNDCLRDGGEIFLDDVVTRTDCKR